MAMTGSGMRDAVFLALFNAGKYGTMTELELADVKENMLLAETARVNYMIATMGVSGITVELPTGAHVISVSGGSGAPAIGVSNPAPETHVQNNDGIGRIS